MPPPEESASPKSSHHRIPPEVEGIQVNFCKSPKCANFGIPADEKRPYRRKTTAPTPGMYTLHGMGKASPAIKCSICSEISPLRSNQAIAEEVTRFIDHIKPEPPPEPNCPNGACSLQGTPLSESGGRYVAFGKTAAGTPRYRCKECGKTFSGQSRVLARQRKSEKNRDVFLLFVNRSPIMRICETTGLGPQAVYDKLKFIHKQCRAFVGNREAKFLSDGFQLPTMYLAVDRQHYIVNWHQRTDRRTVQLNAIGTADLTTSYVLGMHLNFDGTLKGDEIETEAGKTGDLLLASPYRRFARLWFRDDYQEALEDAKKRDAAESYIKKVGGKFTNPLMNEVELGYVDAMVRSDVEESDFKNRSVKLPMHGMQVHEQYTLYAHFFMVARLLRNAPKVRVYMDQDSGFRAAFMAAYVNRIRERTTDGFFVRVKKTDNAYQKQNAVKKARQKFEQFMEDSGIEDEHAAQVEWMKLHMAKAVPLGLWGDKWVEHPLPMASEPSKLISWQTDMGDYDDEHAARLLLRASLHAIDRFFMQTRRRISMAERPVVSVRQQRTMWHGYGAYNPANLGKFLEIYRVYFNYCLPRNKPLSSSEQEARI